MVFDLLDLMLSNLRLDLIAGDLISEMRLYAVLELECRVRGALIIVAVATTATSTTAVVDF
jgi:hypothetical protein